MRCTSAAPKRLPVRPLQRAVLPADCACVIVAIRRDDQILLAQHVRHRGGIHTVLAGFVEVGETLEQAVAREVMEESNIEIKNLRCVTSQPWPFPHSLMMAFMADYHQGDLRHDPGAAQRRLVSLRPTATVAAARTVAPVD